MNIITNIEACEEAYICCFSLKTEDYPISRYEDDALRDMYGHNYSYIQDITDHHALRDMISRELVYAKQAGQSHCKICTDIMLPSHVLDLFPEEVEISHFGNYVYEPMISPEWITDHLCEIRQLNDERMIDDLIKMDMLHDNGVNGEHFSIRKSRRRSRVYLSDAPLNTYICYLDGEPVGQCDLFCTDEIAKIEDFAIVPSHQRRGIGSTVMKYIIDTSLKSGVSIIYLVADEDDTPKNMYKKMGFNKVSESYSYLWRW